MTTNFTSNTYPAYLALTVLQKIIDGQALPEAPLSVEIRKPLETPDDEINSFLSDIRAASNVLNDLEETARCFAVYQCAPACLNIERLDLVRDLYRFLSDSDVSKLIDYALGDIDHAEKGDTLDLFTFDETQALITDLVNPFIDPLDIKKYFDEDRKNCGAFLLVEAGGPTLYFYWLDNTGAFLHATGRSTGGTATRELDTEDLEIINELYFAGEHESILSAELDNDVTREIETINEEEGLNLTSDDFDIDYSELFEDTAEGIAEHFPYWILKNTGVDISATFVELWHPQFYNFETDRIYCDIPRDDIRKLLTWLDTEYPGYFREYVRKTLKPCSGFIPLYSNNLTDWGDFDKWDNVQLSQVLEAVSSVITGNGDNWYDTLEGDYWDQAAGNYSISDYMTRLYNPETGLPADMNVLYCLSFYLPYLVNGDTDNLTVGDMEALQKFEEEYEFIDVIRKSVDNSEYRRCDISGAYGDCEPIAVKPRHNNQEVA